MKNSRFRVAHYMPGFPASDGTTTFCRGLSRAMNRLETDSCVIITRRDDAKSRAEEGDELLIYEKASRNPFALPQGFEDDMRKNRHGIDGVVLHGIYNPPNVGMSRLLNRLGVPYVYMPHDPFSPALKNHHRIRKWVYWHLFEKRMIQNAAAVQLLSQAHEVPLRELGIRTECFTVGNGCEPDEVRFVDPQGREPGTESDFVIQYLGRMDRNHKGLDLLLEGFAKFLDDIGKQRDVRLILSGNDWVDRGWLENLAKNLGIEDHVTFTGRVKDNSVTIHSRADLSVLCSRFDGFGLTIVEAMLASRPVMVSREAGIAEYLEEDEVGFLVKPNSLDIARGLKKAWLSKCDLAEMGKRARHLVETHLTWDIAAEKSLRNYRKYFASS